MGRKQRYPGENKSTGFLKPLAPKNEVQSGYMDMLRESTVTFGLGPAGTGKTYLASYVALDALLNHEVEKIILTRPIVAVEDIGYLPGDMNEKIHPYMMPLFDALEEHLGPTKAKDLLEGGRIEIIPLAFMRGRSLNRAFIILDEAQNTTPEQMKMFLTRLGHDSKMAINGDLAQSDLPRHQVPVNGLDWASKRLRASDPSICMIEFQGKHIVRNPLIGVMLARLEGPADVLAEERRPAKTDRVISMGAPARTPFRSAALLSQAE
jgi:phosphate starvation-inducible PhoH-like protein